MVFYDTDLEPSKDNVWSIVKKIFPGISESLPLFKSTLSIEELSKTNVVMWSRDNEIYPNGFPSNHLPFHQSVNISKSHTS